MFSNLSIGRRLALAFGAVITVFLLVVWSAYSSGAKLAVAEERTVHTYMVLATGERMLQSMVNMETGARGFLLAGKDQYLEPYQGGLAAFEAHWNEAKQLTSDNPSQQKRLADMKAKEAEFVAAAQRMIQLRKDVTAGSQTTEQLVAAFGDGADKAAMDGFRALQSEFDKTERDLLAVRAAEAAGIRRLNMGIQLVGSLMALAAAVGLSLWISRSITGPINEAVKLAETVASGDLTSHVAVTRSDETGRLLQALAHMNASLVKVVSAVRDGSDSIATGSSQIAAGNVDLSQRTEEQASNLQQTAASMEELAGTVRASADTARQANQLAGSASEAAARGGEVVGQVVSTMEAINHRSNKISEIIGVIDGIAFQTNILALNAAVEAARAGEQGRGFAVVAGEVRLLAQRSAEAAREIKSLIAASAETVEAGTRLVSEAGTSMNDIVHHVKRVADLISEISAATVEQSTGIGQVSDAIAQLDQVTQRNAALVEQSAGAAESLKHQADHLVQAVQVFKT